MVATKCKNRRVTLTVRVLTLDIGAALTFFAKTLNELKGDDAVNFVCLRRSQIPPNQSAGSNEVGRLNHNNGRLSFPLFSVAEEEKW